MKFKLMQMNECRPEVVVHFVNEGKKVFNSDPSGQNYFDKVSVVQWLFFQSQESKIEISPLELDKIAKEVHAMSNAVAVFPGHTLSVGELKKSLEKVPDNTPVVYQVIENSYFEKSGWTKYPLQWDKHKAKPKDIEFVEKNPNKLTKIEVKSGVSYLVDYTEYVPAFSALKCRNEKGELVFRIDAHY